MSKTKPRARRLARLLALSAVILGSVTLPAAFAQSTYTCTGVPRGVSMGNGGVLTVESLGGLTWSYLCSVNGPANGVEVSACKALYAGLLAAQATGRSATLWMTNSAGSCGGNTAWAYVAGLYFWRFDN